ncbi:ABC transporter permease [Leeia sp. TBRC 13508]|uniref:ABC transporter permease n=1 Tax=Leeia speluncae TaxID=2884804 RepID=A0ABS8D9T3_9NEIS|nr:ABC transporter permease [Leeia speluncae]MCB6184971.1 ABC transporter permease [Leeia speluncae]
MPTAKLMKMIDSPLAEKLYASEAKVLKRNLRRSERFGLLRALLLIFPLFVFLLLTFILPIGSLLMKSVTDDVIPTEWPALTQSLGAWEPAKKQLPDNQTYLNLVADMKKSVDNDGNSRVASRLNFQQSGMRSLIMKTARHLDSLDLTNPKQALIDTDERWGQVGTWTIIKFSSRSLTFDYFLNAFDYSRDEFGNVVHNAPADSLYQDVFVRTIVVSLTVAVLCVLIAYPVASFLAALPSKYSNPLMILVLLPFWTSFLVRTTAWIVMLQTNGPINQFLLELSLIAKPLELIYNRFSVLVSMTHILLPYSILSLYSVMKGISPVYVKAARSLGAGPIKAFFNAYFPQTLPGVVAAGILSFILSIGYYITPALVGGADDQLASYYIANHVNTTLNWGLASALSVLLLGGVMVLYIVFVRMTGGKGLKLG